MDLAVFERMVDFSKSSLGSEGIPVERSDKTGTAKLFKSLFAKANRASSAAAEMRKTFCVPAVGGTVAYPLRQGVHRRSGENRPSEKTDRFIRKSSVASSQYTPALILLDDRKVSLYANFLARNHP